MFLTIIRDVYEQAYAQPLYEAVDDLCSPADAYGWASVGLYCFWNPDSRAILYIGLARDLAVRFAHHNGLISCPAEGCKRDVIRAYFEESQELGYSIAVQSAFAQVEGDRFRKAYAPAIHDEEAPEFWDLPSDGLDAAKALEGQLIEAFKLRHGTLPPWNKVGGSKEGQANAGPASFEVLDWLSGSSDSLFAARRTIRELSTDNSAAAWEAGPLHTARMWTLINRYPNAVHSDAADPEYPASEDVVGVCPDLRLYDIRVLDANGHGDEFTIMAALQFIRYLNAHADAPLVHGVNLSLSIPHDVSNYACGRTPVCDEAERLVANGAVVVAAAGNGGYGDPTGDYDGYRSISITDPGNAERVITVGSTHRYRPHTYGVSYFSSRGPTGDGRAKPDIVAPGEKIYGPVPGKRVRALDGTSLAAPHVSGAAALLMARHRELVGQPDRVKQILCETATDLGRERYFQGAGMVDVLRALQAV